MIKRIYHSTQWGLWFLLFFLLPLTSFPLVSTAAGSSSVAPASGAAALVLAMVWFFPYVARRGRLPFQSLPLLGFVAAAGVSSALAFFIVMPSFRDFTIFRSEIKALITLLVGVLFFLLVSAWAVDERKLRFALGCLNISGLIVIGWSFAQAYFWKTQGHYPQWMWDIQEMFTVGRLYEFRVTGLALEPSWLAHQLNMLYLPFWLAATIQGESAHPHRLWKFSLENFLLAGGLAVLYLSLSRVGLLAFLSMAAFYILVLNLRLIGWVQKRIAGQDQGDSLAGRFRRGAIGLGLMLALLAFYATLLLGIGYVLSNVDYRMARLFDIAIIKEASFIKYANQLVIAERLVFWQAGWGIFTHHPLFGVGLGNAGFFFVDQLSPYAWALTEVRLAMYHLGALPNIKSLWVRLLAETGLVGFGLFLGWGYGLWLSGRYLRESASRFQRMFGWAGSFVLIGLLIEGFSVDSFALPYFWVSLGLMVGAFYRAASRKASPV